MEMVKARKKSMVKIGQLFNTLRNIWGKLDNPSRYDVWKEAFTRLQSVEKEYGMNREYWRIWHDEVCLAYRDLTNNTLPKLRYPDTDKILTDMDKPINERKYY